MPKYKITFDYRGSVTYHVEAPNEDEAYEKAEDLLDYNSAGFIDSFEVDITPEDDAQSLE